MLVLKLIVWTVDLLLLPFHFIFQQPWKQLRKRNAERLRIEQLNNSEVKLTFSEGFKYRTCEISKMEEAETIDEFFKSTFIKLKERPLFGSRNKLSKILPDTKGSGTAKYTFENVYKWESYSQVNNRVELISQHLLRSCKVTATDSVMICSESRADWMVVALSIFRTNAKLVPIGTSADIETVIYCIEQTKPKVLFTSQPLLGKISKALSLMKEDAISISHIIFFEDPFECEEVPKCIGSVAHVHPFSHLESSTENMDETKALASAPKETVSASKNEIAAIFFTSGTGGDPKGVCFTHQCLIEFIKTAVLSAEKFHTSIDGETFNEVHGSILPLYHIAEFGYSLACIKTGLPIGYSSPFTFLDSSPMVHDGQIGDYRVLCPTNTVVVPLILSRVKTRLCLEIKKKGPVISGLFEFFYQYKLKWRARGYQSPFIDWILFRQFRALLGGRMSLTLMGGALASLDVNNFISTVFNINVCVGFGATETTGAVIFQDCFMGGYQSGIGEPQPGVIAKLVTWDEGGYNVLDPSGPAGELHIHCKSLSAGYLKIVSGQNEEGTLESPFYVDEAGLRWYKTGDIGQVRMGANGSRKVLELIDRKSQLVKMKNGKFVSLCALEEIMTSLPSVDMAMAYIDNLKDFPVAVVVPNQEELSKISLELNLPASLGFKDMCSNESIQKNLLNKFEASFKRNSFEPYEIPRKILLVEEIWTPDSGLLTGALKLRRKMIYQRYQNDIEALFL